MTSSERAGEIEGLVAGGVWSLGGGERGVSMAFRLKCLGHFRLLVLFFPFLICFSPP